MPRPRLHDENLRENLLQRAGRTVAESGSVGLSLRSLAAAESTSTTAVYSLFGGKPGLMAALYSRSFSSFGKSQRAVPRSGDVLEDLAALGRAYRIWALENPHLYAIMFGGALTGFDPDPELAAAAETTIEPLSSVVGAGVQAGLLSGNVEIITFAIWAAVHGVVSLELANCMPPEPDVRQELFDSTMVAAVRGWFG